MYKFEALFVCISVACVRFAVYEEFVLYKFVSRCVYLLQIADIHSISLVLFCMCTLKTNDAENTDSTYIIHDVKMARWCNLVRLVMKQSHKSTALSDFFTGNYTHVLYIPESSRYREVKYKITNAP